MLSRIPDLVQSRASAGILSLLIQGLIVIPLLYPVVPRVPEGLRAHEMIVVLNRAPEPIAEFVPPLPALSPSKPQGEIVPPQVVISRPDTTQDLPPRPDPAHPNSNPAEVGAQSNEHLIVLVRAYILEDGTIGETQIVGSCGVTAMDQIAADYIKASWRFLPATSGGRTTAQWTTVEVLLG